MDKYYCMVADTICGKNKSLARNYQGLARATRKKLQTQGKDVSTKTIWRALKRRAEFPPKIKIWTVH